MTENHISDVLIAGQGAAAFAAGLYSARYQLKTIIASESFGGETAIGGLIENYPGTPDIDGFDLMLKFKEQVDKLEVPTLNQNLTSVVPREDGRFICTLGDDEDAETVDAGSVILCVGRERRTLGLSHEEEWVGKGVSYCSTCDAPLYRGKDAAAVVGGGNAAVEGAILLARYAKHVYLIYRGDKLWRPEPIQLRVLSQIPNVRVLLNTVVTELIGDDVAGLQKLRISRPMDDDEKVDIHPDQTEPMNRSRDGEHGQTVIPVDGLFVEAGADPRLEVPNQLGVELNPETNEVHVDRGQRTSVRGIYAAGDLTDGTTLKQTVTAASQGAVAALSAYNYVLGGEHDYESSV